MSLGSVTDDTLNNYMSSFLRGELEKSEQTFQNNSLGKDKLCLLENAIIWSLFKSHKRIKCGCDLILKSDSPQGIPLSISAKCSQYEWVTPTKTSSSLRQSMF